MYYGLDLHKEFIQVAKISKAGKKCESWKVPTAHQAIIEFAKNLPADAKVVMEATFNTWVVYSLITENFKGEVVVANPLQVKAIAHAKVKTDKVDATILAHLLRCDFIPEVHVPKEKSWQVRRLISHRKLLSKQRTATVNSLKGIFNHKLLKAPRELFKPKGQKWIADQELSEIERFMVENNMKLVKEIDAQLKEIDERLIDLASWEDSIRLLMTIPGVGANTAMCIFSFIEDINRFETPEKLASYFGLTPRVSQSAGKCYYGKISKAGNSTARWYLIEAANQMALSGGPMTATYYKIRKKKGHNVALTALARKITVLMWHMLKKGEPYRYTQVTAYMKHKLRKVSPGLPQPRRGEALVEMGQLYSYLGLPELKESSEGEKRVARINKRRVTLDQKYFGLDKIVRGKNAKKTK